MLSSKQVEIVERIWAQHFSKVKGWLIPEVLLIKQLKQETTTLAGCEVLA